ncbi:hypothetical protein ACFL1M_02995 [Patescibacteria group bacterium]
MKVLFRRKKQNKFQKFWKKLPKKNKVGLIVFFLVIIGAGSALALSQMDQSLQSSASLQSAAKCESMCSGLRDRNTGLSNQSSSSNNKANKVYRRCMTACKRRYRNEGPKPKTRPTTTPTPTTKPTTTPTPKPGCYYKNVQCFQAPCDPVMVCPEPTTIPNATAYPIPTTSPDPIPEPYDDELAICNVCMDDCSTRFSSKFRTWVSSWGKSADYHTEYTSRICTRYCQRQSLCQ